ncbi:MULTISPECIES: ATP-binding protein [unclassified Modestobacter]|uniref:ATP-binding protein n=1 Tax=unclassified Modestobacter TaxID=2643866 RepID=UPI0022AAF1DB|nr:MULTISPECIES: ATP-binding protein [unclassified Modestobacter]MCZ2826064.1 ATP-binding protein [Modestobacter sp. VKM Ac-2981]MCZ2852871.1 ATP-binding protein [Modestobacter sp. VKM Ac-2982]
MSALPTSRPDAAQPFESLLTTLGGGSGASVHVLVVHDDYAGLRLYLGSADADTLALARTSLAPACDVVPSPGAAMPTGGVAVGVAYRLLPDLRRDGDVSRGPVLLEKLALQPGTWAVLLTLEAAGHVDVGVAESQSVELAHLAAENLTSTRQRTATQSVATVSAHWSRVQEWLGVLQGYLAQGSAFGMWLVTCWAMAEDDRCAARVLACLHGAVAEDQGRRFRALDLDLDETGAALPPLSVLTSTDVAGLLATPAAAAPGLAVRKSPPAHRRPNRSGDALTLGTYWSTELEAAISLTDLEGHAFVTGTTGSGKTTTLHRLLAEVWNRHGVPFLVIDPVKDEYSSAASLFRGGLTVVTGSELRMNLMQPWPGEDPIAHVTRVSQAFRGAFTMPPPTPYVVTQLFDAVAMQPGGPEGTELYDVRDRLEGLVSGLGYAPEAHSNILASLTTRLAVLLGPVRAHRFAWPDSAMIDRLLDRPSVVTLADLVDDEERAFVVLLLAMATQARARARHRPKPVEHVLVLEEAHRVIPEVPAAQEDGASGSARRISAELLSSLLAEVRSFGEQVIVVDQSPAKVASDVLRNTNVKIAHRVVHPEDQASLAGALGLPTEDADLLGGLARGQAIVSTRREPSPQTVHIALAGPFAPPGTARTGPSARTPWPCCEDHPVEHFRAWQSASLGDAAMALFVVATRVGDGDGRAVRKQAYEALTQAGSTANLRTSCLAWSALRRSLTRERGVAVFLSAAAVDAALAAMYELWLAGVPVTAQTALDYAVPAPVRRTCPDCGARCGVRLPAWTMLRDAPRTGPASLAGPAWRQDLPDVADYLKDDVARLTGLLGEDGARTVVRCQVHQAVARSRLPRDVTTKLLTRAGIS